MFAGRVFETAVLECQMLFECPQAHNLTHNHCILYKNMDREKVGIFKVFLNCFVSFKHLNFNYVTI